MRRMTAFAVAAVVVLNAASSILAAGQSQTTGALQGTAQTPAGQTLPNFTVQFRNLQTGQLAGSTSSNAAGAFSFTGLNPASYVVEIVNQAGTIVGTSSAVTVSAGMTVSVSITAAAAAAITGSAAAGAAAAGAAGTATGISTALVISTVATGAGIAGVVVAANKEDASPSR